MLNHYLAINLMYQISKLMQNIFLHQRLRDRSEDSFNRSSKYMSSLHEQVDQERFFLLCQLQEMFPLSSQTIKSLAKKRF